MQFPPFIHLHGSQPFSKPEIPSSVPRGRRPHCPGRTSMCPPGPPFETLLAAGSEPKCSAPSPGSLPLSKTHLTPCLTACSGALAGVPEPLPRAHLVLCTGLPVHLELRTCSVAPSAAGEGNDFLFPVLGAEPSWPHWLAPHVGPRSGGGATQALVCPRPRITSPVTGAGLLFFRGHPAPRTPPRPAVQNPQLQLPQLACPRIRLHPLGPSGIRPSPPEVRVGNVLDSSCRQ